MEFFRHCCRILLMPLRRTCPATTALARLSSPPILGYYSLLLPFATGTETNLAGRAVPLARQDRHSFQGVFFDGHTQQRCFEPSAHGWDTWVSDRGRIRIRVRWRWWRRSPVKQPAARGTCRNARNRSRARRLLAPPNLHHLGRASTPGTDVSEVRRPSFARHEHDCACSTEVRGELGGT